MNGDSAHIPAMWRLITVETTAGLVPWWCRATGVTPITATIAI